MNKRIKQFDMVVCDKVDSVGIVTDAYSMSNITVAFPVGTPMKFDHGELRVVGGVNPKSKYDFLKMYVIVDNAAPIGLGINGAVHVAYGAGSKKKIECIHRFKGLDLVDEWTSESYRNVTCTGESGDIATAIAYANTSEIPVVKFYEPDWTEANGRPLAVAFGPAYEWPDIFKKFNLHSGS